jgi:hypothetical protein
MTAILGRFRRWVAGQPRTEEKMPMIDHDQIRAIARATVERKLGRTIRDEVLQRAVEALPKKARGALPADEMAAALPPEVAGEMLAAAIGACESVMAEMASEYRVQAGIAAREKDAADAALLLAGSEVRTPIPDRDELLRRTGIALARRNEMTVVDEVLAKVAGAVKSAIIGRAARRPGVGDQPIGEDPRPAVDVPAALRRLPAEIAHLVLSAAHAAHEALQKDLDAEIERRSAEAVRLEQERSIAAEERRRMLTRPKLYVVWARPHSGEHPCGQCDSPMKVPGGPAIAMERADGLHPICDACASRHESGDAALSTVARYRTGGMPTTMRLGGMDVPLRVSAQAGLSLRDPGSVQSLAVIRYELGAAAAGYTRCDRCGAAVPEANRSLVMIASPSRITGAERPLCNRCAAGACDTGLGLLATLGCYDLPAAA